MYHLITDSAADAAAYGIEGFGERYESLSTQYDAVTDLVRRCIEGDLAPWQLRDVAQDFVTCRSLPEFCF